MKYEDLRQTMSNTSFMIDDALIEHIAKLAKIHIDASEMKKITASLQGTLALAQQIQDIEALACPYTVGTDALTLAEVPDDSPDHEDQTPAFERSLGYFKDGFFHVPAFLED